MIKTNKARFFLIILSLFESAFIVCAVIVPVLVYLNREYTSLLNGMISCECMTSFNYAITSSDGTEYPANTLFRVYFFTGSGGLGLLSSDNNLVSHGEIKIEETNNPDELRALLNERKTVIGEQYSISTFKVLLIGFFVLIAISIVLYKINNSHTQRGKILLLIFHMLLSFTICGILFIFMLRVSG